jgi:hypothetical protein
MRLAIPKTETGKQQRVAKPATRWGFIAAIGAMVVFAYCAFQAVSDLIKHHNQ